jgi:hypothetical protein
MVHKNQTNFSSLINGSKNKMPNGLHFPWNQWKSSNIKIDLEDFLAMGLGEMWLKTYGKNPIILKNYDTNIIIKNTGWFCHKINLDPWIIISQWQDLTLKIEIVINQCYLTNHNGSMTLIIKNPSNNGAINHITSFIVKKQNKNSDYNSIIYIIDDNNCIINKISWSFSGYFFINSLDQYFHQFFQSCQE